MSLLQKASIITTPTAYAEDYLYSIKPAIPFGEELVTNGNFYSNSDWNLDSGWSISGGKLIATNTALEATQTNVFTPNKTYEVTFTIDSISSGSVKIKAGTTNGSIRTTAGTYTQVLTVLFGTSLVFDMHSSGSCVIDNVSAKEITDADFDFDRNSTGTRVNEDYLIEDVPYNIFSYSEDFTNSYWSKYGTVETTTVKAPYSTANAIKLIRSTGTYNIIRPQTNIVGTIFTQSIFVKNIDADNFYIRSASGFSFYNFANKTTSSANLVATSAGNGWIKLTTNDVHATFKQFGIGESETDSTELNNAVYIWGAQITKGDQPKDYLKTIDRLDIPRIDYTNGEPSILLEPSRTNLIPNSTTTIANNTTIEYNNILSPENISNGVKVTSTASSAYVRTDTVAMTSNNTISVFLKAGTSNYAQVLGAGNAGDFFNINLDNFTIGNTGATTSNVTIQQYSNNWYRCSAKFAGYTGNTTIRLLLSDSDSNFNATSSTTGKFLYYYGLQLETGSYATSLIHTSGSAVTRSADSANNAGNSDLINSTEGVLYAEIKSFIETPPHRRTIALSDGTSAVNVVRILYLSNTANNILGQVRANNTLTASIDKTVSTTLEYHKVAVKYKENDFALWVDGEQINTDTSVAVPSANTMLRLDFSDGNNTNKFNEGEIKMVAVFKEALTDLELEKLTGYNNHELYMNYYNRLSYLGLAEEYNVESDINNYIL